jgi:hypothetical protein
MCPQYHQTVLRTLILQLKDWGVLRIFHNTHQTFFAGIMMSGEEEYIEVNGLTIHKKYRIYPNKFATFL